jgi:hypothetical protein
MKLGACIALAAFGLLLTPLAAQEGSRAIVHKQLSVVATNDDWASTHVKLEPGGLVVVLAEGQVALGGLAAAVDAEGQATSPTFPGLGGGTLVGKVGTGSAFRVGKRGAFEVGKDQAGTLKLRIYDSDYTDNKGTLAVRVIYMPPGTLPEAESVPEEE